VTATSQSFPVRIETLPARRVAYLRHVGPYQSVGPTFQQLMAYAGQHGLFGPATVVLGVCWDDPEMAPPERIRYDCCVTVGEAFTPDGEVQVQTIEGGEYASATHVGPYEKLREIWSWVYGTWLPASGRTTRQAPPFEVYRNSPMDTPPEKLITEICVPLKPR
jgi:AraC family transcriptional regulator